MKVTTRAAEAVAAAYTRWQHYHELHRGREPLESVELETQFELVATGLVALDENQIFEMFQADAQLFVALLTPFLTLAVDDLDSFQQQQQQIQFTFVCAAEMLSKYLHGIKLSKELNARRLLTGPLTTQVLLPLLQHDHFVRVH